MFVIGYSCLVLVPMDSTARSNVRTLVRLRWMMGREMRKEKYDQDDTNVISFPFIVKRRPHSFYIYGII